MTKEKQKTKDTFRPLYVSSVEEIQKEKPKDKERGGPRGLEPTRYGDWERGGKCVDF